MAGGLDAGAFEAVRSARDDAAATVLRRGLDAVSVGRSAGGEILTGDPAEALAAASADLDLLVCGSRGYGPFARCCSAEHRTHWCGKRRARCSSCRHARSRRHRHRR